MTLAQDILTQWDNENDQVTMQQSFYKDIDNFIQQCKHKYPSLDIDWGVGLQEMLKEKKIRA